MLELSDIPMKHGILGHDSSYRPCNAGLMLGLSGTNSRILGQGSSHVFCNLRMILRLSGIPKDTSTRG